MRYLRSLVALGATALGLALPSTPAQAQKALVYCPVGIDVAGQSDELIGAPFYVMERVHGTPYRTAAELEPRAVEAEVVTRVVLHGADHAVAAARG